MFRRATAILGAIAAVVGVMALSAASAQEGGRLNPRLTDGQFAWNAVPAAVSYRITGNAFYYTNCDLTRRLEIREGIQSIDRTLDAPATALDVPPPPDPDLELNWVTVVVRALAADGAVLASESLNTTRTLPEACALPPGEEPAMTLAPPSGPCDGSITISGVRFPALVIVVITLARFGTDEPGPVVAVATVASDGRFSAAVDLSTTEACERATESPTGTIGFVAYNADAPLGLTGFASAGYATRAQAPEVGTGSAPRTGTHLSLPAVLFASGLALAAAGALARRRY